MNELLQQLSIPKTNILKGRNSRKSGRQEVPPYVLNEKIVTVLKVAMATGRPLLISGPPGCGKSTLARSLAHHQKWSFLSHTLTSRSKLEDLTADIDQLQRLHDAHIGTSQNPTIKDESAYQKPGIFWWAFNPNTAEFRGCSPIVLEDKDKIKPPKGLRKNSNITILLLDEIDKADPDLPNDLLEPLDGRAFKLPNGTQVTADDQHDFLTIITTNEERELPQAFQRRCVFLQLGHSDQNGLVVIAKHHLGKKTFNQYKQLIESVAAIYTQIADTNRDEDKRIPGTSEFMDAVNACIELKMDNQHPHWEMVVEATLKKSSQEDS